MSRSKVVDLTRQEGEHDVTGPGRVPSLVLCLSRLTGKYNTLLALRLQREHLESNGIFSPGAALRQARRQTCRELARAFPGALRELDTRDSRSVAACLSDLADERARAYAQPGAERAERFWVQAVLAYHATMQRVLALRNRARAQSLAEGPASLREQRFLAWYATISAAASAGPTGDLERLARGRGRAVVPLVCEEVAAALGCGPEAVRRGVFG